MPDVGSADEVARCRVVVVGGGSTGVGVARDLAMRGVSVTLCERGGLGTGTTGHSHGLLHSGARYATTDLESAAECLAENRILRRIGGAAVRETGGLFVRLADDDPGYVERLREACRTVGIPVDGWTGERAREAEPALASDVEAALRVPDAVVYPSRLVAATAASARAHGATLRLREAVTDLEVEGGRVAAVETDRGRIESDQVVNAAGPWAGRVAALAGADLPMAPTRGVMVAVHGSPLEHVANRCRPPDDGDIVVPHPSRAVLGTTSAPVDEPEALASDGEPGSAEEDAVVEDGVVDDATVEDGVVDDAVVERLLAEGAAMVPSLADATVADVYWGLRPIHGETGGRDASRGYQVHEHDDDGLAGLTSVTGGKLTTHRLMAETVADVVCERLGVDAPCRTADEPLPADDARELDERVATFDARNPADADVVGL